MATSLYDHPLVTDECWEKYTEEEHRRWAFMFRRQQELLPNRAASEVIEGMKKLNICEHMIPKFSDLNKVLLKTTGFSVVPVKSLIPEDLFFQLLSERKFPGTCFIRREDQIDYLQEPDVFHEAFGHLPLLAHPVFADYMEAFGRMGLEGIAKGLHRYVSALYWFTVEFGLIQTAKGLRIYGAGITSSISESIYSLESDIPTRVWFDPIRAMKTKYRIDDFQKTYFVIRNYDELFSLLKKINWDEIKDQLLRGKDIEEGEIVSQSEIVKR